MCKLMFGLLGSLLLSGYLEKHYYIFIILFLYPITQIIHNLRNVI